MLNKRDCWKEENQKEILQYTSLEFWRIVQRNAKEVSPLSLFLDLTKLLKQ
jgi:hypothetical protein